MRRKIKLYYVNTGHGCGIRAGLSLEDVEREELKSVGTYVGVDEVREATTQDIAFVRAMGGYIPEIGK